MARNSWGSTRKLPSGRVQARYLGPDGKTHKAPDTFPDKLSALAWLAEVRRSIDLGVWESPRDAERVPTVGELVHHWLTLTGADVRSSTLKAYTDIVNKRILNHPDLSGVRVDRLTTVRVARWWAWVVKNYPGTPQRNSKAYQKLRSAISLAVDYGYLPSNPVNVKAATKRPRPRHKELPSVKDMAAIVGEINPRLKLVTVLCLFHGLRLGEALALKGRHVCVEDDSATVTVEATLCRVPNGNGGVMMDLHPPKTQAGYRTVPILSEYVHVVREHLGTYQPGADDYATTTATGQPVMDTSYRSHFHRAKDRAGVTARITPHYGRNWLITRLAEAGATPKEIGRILGQEDVSTIVGVYMRVRESRPAELMKRVDPLA